MANRNDWGDKSIICLVSDGERRHKKWCAFEDNGYCSRKCRKCTGSAHCEEYVKRFGAGPMDTHAFARVPIAVERIVIKDEFNVPPSSTIPRKPSVENQIPGRHPYFDEKLVGKVILAKITGNKIVMGEVVSDTADFITVDRDDGVVVKYDRRKTFSLKTVWVLDEYSDLLAPEEPDIYKFRWR